MGHQVNIRCERKTVSSKGGSTKVDPSESGYCVVKTMIM